MVLDNFYSVKSSVENNGFHITEVEINKGHELYKGHFPNRPVTPGVVLMHLFKEEVERISNKKLQLVRANNVKFTAVCDPNNDPNLILESEIEDAGEFFKLKAIAKNKNGIVLKINSLYQ
ncbi:hydroxymyristoyl-ACP dehydratase [Gramella sp. AN32]|uniref:Hydroxymyristoyl-ACP dehydratase n=1 Tax=Christiangramia antarctica TaxID=2058158 RepID=A0ABW5X1K5_9FLAO|nr:hydroxymyristoyl-ACP dehydratase [Gramella sp. AN32]MCM4156765.1 hydroxymyristoyl-ACP dehydratase [Gramella sp. AN32]